MASLVTGTGPDDADEVVHEVRHVPRITNVNIQRFQTLKILGSQVKGFSHFLVS